MEVCGATEFCEGLKSFEQPESSNEAESERASRRAEAGTREANSFIEESPRKIAYRAQQGRAIRDTGVQIHEGWSPGRSCLD
jgi:Tfp pilus assembly protein PilX